MDWGERGTCCMFAPRAWVFPGVYTFAKHLRRLTVRVHLVARFYRCICCLSFSSYIIHVFAGLCGWFMRLIWTGDYPPASMQMICPHFWVDSSSAPFLARWMKVRLIIHWTIFICVQPLSCPISLLIPIISPTLSMLLSLPFQLSCPSLPPPCPFFPFLSLPPCSPAVTFWLACSLIIIRTEPLMNRVTWTNCSQCFKIPASVDGEWEKMRMWTFNSLFAEF